MCRLRVVAVEGSDVTREVAKNVIAFDAHFRSQVSVRLNEGCLQNREFTNRLCTRDILIGAIDCALHFCEDFRVL